MKPGHYKNRNLAWKGDRLVVQGGGRSAPFVDVVPDGKYAGMWRVRLPDGALSDMMNRARARDAARSLLLGILNTPETRSTAAPMRLDGVSAATLAAASEQHAQPEGA
jgi:hypothetical protein